MTSKYLLPGLLASALVGCASLDGEWTQSQPNCLMMSVAYAVPDDDFDGHDADKLWRKYQCQSARGVRFALKQEGYPLDIELTDKLAPGVVVGFRDMQHAMAVDRIEGDAVYFRNTWAHEEPFVKMSVSELENDPNRAVFMKVARLDKPGPVKAPAQAVEPRRVEQPVIRTQPKPKPEPVQIARQTRPQDQPQTRTQRVTELTTVPQRPARKNPRTVTVPDDTGSATEYLIFGK